MSPTRRREAVARAMASFQISERRACRALGVPRSSQRYAGAEREPEEELLLRIRALARENGRVRNLLHGPSLLLILDRSRNLLSGSRDTSPGVDRG